VTEPTRPTDELEAPAYAGRSFYADAEDHVDRWNPALRGLGALFGLCALMILSAVAKRNWIVAAAVGVIGVILAVAIAAIGVRDIRKMRR